MTGNLTQDMCKSLVKYNIHCSSNVAIARAQYSVADEGLDIERCFFVLRDFKDLPKKKHWPQTDLLESMQHAQSVSDNPRI